MRLVLDTNTVISALLWNGQTRRLLDAAFSGTVDLYTSAVLATELREVLAYPKFAKRLSASGETTDRCLGRYLALVNLTAAATPRGRSHRRPR